MVTLTSLSGASHWGEVGMIFLVLFLAKKERHVANCLKILLPTFFTKKVGKKYTNKSFDDILFGEQNILQEILWNTKIDSKK